MSQEFCRLLQLQEILPPKLVHKYMMTYLWTIGIDIGIFFAIYKYRKYGIILHVIIGLFVSLSTLSTAFIIYVDSGIPTAGGYKRTHVILGLVTIGVLFGQLLLGIMSSLSIYINWKRTYIIYVLRRAHKFLGYTLVIMAKVQCFYRISQKFDQDQVFWGLISAQIFLFLMWIVRIVFFPTFQQKIMPSYPGKNFKMIQNLKQLQLNDNENVGVFANFVYNLSPLKRFHPAGGYIVETVKGRSLDRYLYGMYRSQRVPNVPAHIHSYKALSLVGDPIAKLSIPAIYSGFDSDIVQVKISKVAKISQKGHIYQVYFQKIYQQPFGYNGYSSLNQIGRFYSITVNKTITRLYTSVGLLNHKNIVFLNKYLNFSTIQDASTQGTTNNIQISAHYQNEFVLLMKKYSKGKLSTSLTQNLYQTIQLSTAQGEGLNFSQLKPGKIIILAGGTGLYPFSDLIDLLYKTLLLKINPQLRQQIIAIDPLLSSNPFSLFNFTLYLSVNDIEDIHPITLAQLNQLSKHPKMLRLVLRISQGLSIKKTMINQNVTFVSQRFSHILQPTLLSQTYEKIWVCGPPAMDKEMINLFDKLEINSQKYLIV